MNDANLSDDTHELKPQAKWPLFVAIVASSLWLAFSILAFAPTLFDIASLNIAPLLSELASASLTILLLTAPLAVIWLVALKLRERSGSRAERTALMAQHADFIDRKLDHGATALTILEDRLTLLASRIEGITQPVDMQHTALVAAIIRLEATGDQLTAVSSQVEAATVTLGAATPNAIAQAENLLALLNNAATDIQQRLAETETLLAGLHSGAEDARAQALAAATHTTAHIEAINVAAAQARDTIAVPLAHLVEGADAAFIRTAAAMDATRDGVHAQTNALLASIDRARVTLDHIGGEAARLVHIRLETLLGTAATLGAEIGSQTERANVLIEDVTRGFTILDAKLGNAAVTSNTTLEAISTRMNAAREAIFRLGEPIAATETALATVETRLGSLATAANETLSSLGTTLPAALPHLDEMAIRLSELHDRVDQLSSPLQAGGNSIAEAHGQLERAREAMEAAAKQLAIELTTARDILSEIDTMTGSASLAASSQLIEVFTRVREVANQTAGTMRETLSGVVAEAEAALDHAGSTRAELAFGAPIRAELAEVEAVHDRVSAAGQAAAERITKLLLALSETVAGVEARIDEADTKFEVRARNTLAKRSSLLIDSMQSAAIDIAGLLSFQIEDTAWDSYLKGDKSIFTRRIVDQLDSHGTRAIGRHFEHDPEFRSQATQYINDFETLISHVLPDREGQSLAVTLLSSNIGRLYVALAQSVSRFS